MDNFLEFDNNIDNEIEKLGKEIRDFDLLNEYKFELMPVSGVNTLPKEKIIYFEICGNKLSYTVWIRRNKVEDTLDNNLTEPLMEFLENNREAILERMTERGHISSSLQPKVNQYYSLTAYKYYSQDGDSTALINNLIKKALQYSDRSENEYRSSFKANFSQILFELAMFDFINRHKNFKKIEQEKSNASKGSSNKPDLIFQENDEVHYIECTTNTSSLFDKFIKLKRMFDDYLKAAAVLYESFKKTQEIYHNRKDTPLYSSAMLNVVYELNFYEKNFFIECMSRSMNSKIKISLEEAVKLFLEYTKVYAIRQWKCEVPTQINRAATVRERIISKQIRAT